MKRKTKGIAFGGKSDGERKRDEPRKKKVPTVTSNWGSKKSKTRETAERSPVKRRPSYEVLNVKIADIKITGRRRALNPAKIKELAKSISLLGLQSPITVRLVKRDLGWGKTKTEWVLVSGLHRMAAMKQLGQRKILCFIIAGGKRVARMSEIAENLHRVELMPLEHDEGVAEWVRLLEAEQAFSGQNVQKRDRGRPESGISEAARRLPIKGKSHAAKRKNVERALKVASIFPEAKDAAKKAGLDKNRSKLLKVAAEKTLDAQLAKVRELKQSSRGTKRKTAEVSATTPLSVKDKEALEQLVEDWNDAVDLRRKFITASSPVREQFLENIRQDHSLGTPRDGRSTRSHWA